MFFLRTRCAVAFNMDTWIPLVSFALLQDPNVTQLEITLNRARPGPQAAGAAAPGSLRLCSALLSSAQLCSALLGSALFQATSAGVRAIGHLERAIAERSE